jgi:subtilisin family serine protease
MTTLTSRRPTSYRKSSVKAGTSKAGTRPPFVYSLKGEKIPLRLSNDDIAVGFTGAKAGAIAAKAFHAIHKSAKAAAREDVRVAGNILLIHQRGAAKAQIATTASVLPKAQVAKANRSYPVYVDEDSGLRLVAIDEIIVRFRPKTTASQRNALLRGLDLEQVESSRFADRRVVVRSISLQSGSRVVDLANRLNEAGLVEYATPNFLAEYKKFAAPNDPLFDDQWHLDNQGADGALAGEDVRALDAWTVTPGGDKKVVIAIVDDGVQTRHPDLKANIWKNPTRGAPDRNGRNFADPNRPNDPNPRVFVPPYDDTGTNDIHGTCCAGVAAAAGHNKKGGLGIAYRARILPVKIFAGANLAPNAQIADAIRYAGLHADVISCSWGIPRNADVEAAIEDVVRTGRGGKGCVVCCATGNEYESSIGFPASHAKVFAVGASNDQGKRSEYSNHGKGIAFTAPSSDDDRNRPGITTTDLSTANRGYALKSAYTADFGGTSSATPLAAGIAALVLSVKSSLTWKQVGSILKSTADKIDRTAGKYKKGFSLQYGYGRLNAHKAVVKAAKPK